MKVVESCTDTVKTPLKSLTQVVFEMSVGTIFKVKNCETGDFSQGPYYKVGNGSVINLSSNYFHPVETTWAGNEAWLKVYPNAKIVLT